MKGLNMRGSLSGCLVGYLRAYLRAYVKASAGVLLVVLASAAQAQWANGEIRRIDAQNLRLTIKHGEIKALDMPPMTMVFYVKDPVLLQGLAVQDTIEFQASLEGTKYYLTEVKKLNP
jgi:Cu(I)/Ag(I) efflux system protein CusF